jgi:hypothetical protein
MTREKITTYCYEMSETDPEEKNRDSFLEGREITQGQ